MPAPSTAQRVRDSIGPVVSAAGLWLEDVEVVKAGAQSVVRVLLDLAEDEESGGLDLDRVALVAEDVSAALDEADVVPGVYTLEVSSPGVGRTLTERRHFVHARGRLVDLRLRDGGTLHGRLTEVDRTTPDTVLVLVPVVPGVKGRPTKTGAPVRLALAEVLDGRVDVELGRLAEVDDDAADAAADEPSGREG